MGGMIGPDAGAAAGGGGATEVTVAAIKTAIELIDHLSTADAGNSDAGTQRMTLATDDINMAKVVTALELIDHLTASNSGNKDANTQRVVVATDDPNLSAIKTALELIDHLTASNAGNLDANTQRVAIATDDVNISKISATIAAKEAATPANVIQVGIRTVDGVPTELTADKLAPFWADLFSRLIIGGYNPAVQSLDINDPNPAALLLYNEVNLNAVTSATEGPARDMNNYGRKTVYVQVSVNTGAVTVTIEHSPDGTVWYVADEETYTASVENQAFTYEEHFPYMRTKTSSQANATVTATIVGRGL